MKRSSNARRSCERRLIGCTMRPCQQATEPCYMPLLSKLANIMGSGGASSGEAGRQLQRTLSDRPGAERKATGAFLPSQAQQDIMHSSPCPTGRGPSGRRSTR